MCVAVGIGLAVVGGAISIIGQSRAANAAQANAETNERLALIDSAAVGNQARQDLFKHAIESRRSIGTQEAIAAAANLDLSFGSAAEVLGDRFRFSAMDSIAIAQNAKNKSTALRNSAAVFRSQGRNIQSASTLNSIATAVNTSSSVLSFSANSNSQNRLISALNSRGRI